MLYAASAAASNTCSLHIYNSVLYYNIEPEKSQIADFFVKNHAVRSFSILAYSLYSSGETPVYFLKT